LNHLELTLLTLPGTARYCQNVAVLWRQGRDQTAGARENPKLPSDGFLAAGRLESERSKIIKIRVVFGLLWFCHVLSFYLSQVKRKERRTYRHIYDHLCTSSIIFHPLPSSSIIFQIYMDFS